MLIEIILAFVIAMGISYFMFELIIKIKNKNDDLLVKTVVVTDQTIITNKLMKYALDEKNNFDCNKLSVNDNVISYDGKVINIISEYADVGSMSCNNTNNIVTISIPLSVKQLQDDNFNISVNYRYGAADGVNPTCSLSVNSSNMISASYSDETGGSGISYHGWSSSYSGDVSNSKTLNGIGTYTYYVKDMAGNTGSCSITVVATDASYSCPHYGSAPDSCYYTYSASSSGGTCTCYSNNNNYSSVKANSNACYSHCLNSYGTDAYYFGNITYSCPNGGSLSGAYCMVGESADVIYSCPSGYPNKINNSYCYKTN